MLSVNENRSLSSTEQATIKAIVHSLLSLYKNFDHPDTPSSPNSAAKVDSIGEARRPPSYRGETKVKSFWGKFKA